MSAIFVRNVTTRLLSYAKARPFAAMTLSRRHLRENVAHEVSNVCNKMPNLNMKLLILTGVKSRPICCGFFGNSIKTVIRLAPLMYVSCFGWSLGDIGPITGPIERRQNHIVQSGCEGPMLVFRCVLRLLSIRVYLKKM